MVRKTSLTDEYKCSTLADFRPYAYTQIHTVAFLFISVRSMPQNPFAPWPNVFHQKYRRRRDAGLSSSYIRADHSSASVCVCVCSAPIHLVAPETNKAPNTHINVKYGRFNDTFWCRCGVYIGPNRAEFDAFGTDTATQLSLLRAHTEPRVTDTTIDEQHTHTPAAMGIYVF